MQNDHNSKAPCKDHRTRSIWNTFSTLTIRRMNVFGKSALRKTIGRNPKRAARCCRPASIRFRMIPLLGRLTLCGICRVATIGASQKQIFRHFCNFFAIRDSFLFPQSGNRLLDSRLPALLHRDLRSGESITIPNRKKVAIRADFLFSISPQRLQGGVGAEQPKFGVAGWFKCGSNLALRNKSTTV